MTFLELHPDDLITLRYLKPLIPYPFPCSSLSLYRRLPFQCLFLVLFFSRTFSYSVGTDATVSCPIVSNFARFKSSVDKAHTSGDTALYDALGMAKDQLDAFCTDNPNAVDCRKRILCLSDGAGVYWG